jgi:hypothetical protein
MIGFHINGSVMNDYVGYSVAVGDVNGDGIADVIMGGPMANRIGANQGMVSVVYGMTGATRANVALLGMTPSVGFSLYGVLAGSYTGWEVAVGDVNSDNIGDIIIGAYYATVSGRTNCGMVHVVYGKTGTSRTDINLVSMATDDGYDIIGYGASHRLGLHLAVGDVNNDTIGDVLMSATGAPPGGQVLILYGETGSTRADVDLLTANVTSYMRISGIVSPENVGSDVAAIDINNDNVPDILVGASQAALPGRNNVGKVYVVLLWLLLIVHQQLMLQLVMMLLHATTTR